MTLKIKTKQGIIKTINNVISSFFDDKGVLKVGVVGKNTIIVKLDNVKCIGIYDYDE